MTDLRSPATARGVTAAPTTDTLHSLDTLLAGIADSAADELRQLQADAEAYASAKATATRAKVEALLAEAANTAAEQAEAIRRNAESRLALERKKGDLAARERLNRDVEARARAQFDELAQTPAYRHILASWLAEAAVGLGDGPATVISSPADWPLLDDGLLRAAEALAAQACGRRVSLRRAERPILNERGVELVAEGGRLSYTNTIRTRFARAANASRALIQAAFGDETKTSQ
ncbi:MAG TPA: hypothetical protein DCX65_06185 [Spirochaetaceae bacterium]|nr:hypothetical protein [Spirochaetaceae bacterium]